MILVLLAGLLGAYFLMRRRQVDLLTLLLVTALLPSIQLLDRSIEIGDLNLFASDVAFVFASLGFYRSRAIKRNYLPLAVLVFGALIALNIARGVALYGTNAAFADGRGLVYLMGGIALIGGLSNAEAWRVVGRSLAVVLVAAALAVAELTFGGVVADRVDATGSDDGLRILLVTTNLAYLVLVGGTLAIILKAHLDFPQKYVTSLVVASAFLTLVGASRRFLLIALAAVVIIALLRRHLKLKVAKSLVSMGIVALFAAMSIWLGVPTRLLGENNPITTSIATFTGVVGEKLEDSDQAGDEWRARENQLAQEYTKDRWLVGGGLGASYRPRQALSPFEDESAGQRYVHNYYYWLLVKMGLIGVIAFGWVFVTALRLTISKKSQVREVIVVAALLSFLPSLLYAPALTRPGTSLAIGVLIGLELTYTKRIDASEVRAKAPKLRGSG